MNQFYDSSEVMSHNSDPLRQKNIEDIIKEDPWTTVMCATIHVTVLCHPERHSTLALH